MSTSALLTTCPLCRSPPFSTRRSHSAYSRRPVRCQAETEAYEHTTDRSKCSVTRRQALVWAASAALIIPCVPTAANAASSQASAPSTGYRVHQDKFDGYRFRYPQSWTPVTVIGSPDKVADKARRQYLRELMSTRLGVRRESEIVSASDRTGADGNEYYDLQLRLKSYASRKQLAVTQAEIEGAMELEWDRRLITVLGTANNRLYEFRLQTANKTYESSKDPLLEIAKSFSCFTIDA